MKKFLFSLAVLAFVVPATVSAADFRSASKGEVSVAKTENVKNLYVAGQSVKVDSNVQKDLFIAAGDSVDVNGNVENSLFAVGSTTVTINGRVGDSAKVAGGTVNLNGPVGQDLMVAGTEINLSQSAFVEGDFLAVGSTINLDGQVFGDVKLTGTKITISGKVSGDVNIGNVQSLTVTADAMISGKLVYSSVNQASIDTNAIVTGGTLFTQTSANQSSGTPFSGGTFMMAWIYKILCVLVFLIVLIYLLPKFTSNLIEKSSTSFWSNLGLGFAAIILAPAVFICLFALVITAGISLALLFLYLTALILSIVVVGLNIGAWVQKALLKQKDFEPDWKTAFLGAFFLFAISLIPVFGWLIITILYLAALGSLTRVSGEFIATNRK